MNKRAYIFYLSVFVVGFVIAYVVGLKEGTDEGKALSDQVVNINSNGEKTTTTEGYWVKVHNNKIIVYKSDGSTVIAETDIDIKDYSASEQNILQDGIYLESSEKLFKFLEANTS